MRKLLEKWDIDYDQLKVLFKIGLKLDFQTIGTRSQQWESKAQKYAFLYTLFAYCAMSLFFCFLIIKVNDIYTFIYMILAYSMVMTSMAVLIEFYAVVVHPQDFEILGHRPISSTTYFFTKLLNLTFYITLITTSLITLPVIATIYKVRFMFVMSPFVYLVCLSAGLTSAFFVICVYTWLMSKIQYEKLQTVLGYLQMIFSFLIFGGYQFVGKLFGNSFKDGFSFSGNHWLWFTPMAWYAGFCELLYGNITLLNICLSLIATLVSILLVYIGTRKISQTYALAISTQQVSVNAELTVSERQSWSHKLANMISDSDIRVGFTLVSLYLKRDKKLRMAVLPMFGLILFYYFYPSMFNHKMSSTMDIFKLKEFGEVFGNMMFTMLVPIFTGGALAIIRYSTDWQASWIYYTTPISPSRLYMGAYLSTVTWVMFPMLVGTTILFSFSMPVLHAIPQALLIFILADLYAVLGHLLIPHLPLSAPFSNQGRQGKLVLVMFLGMFFAIGILVLEYFAFKYVLTTIALFILLIGLSTGLHFLESLRIQSSYRKFEFVE